MADELQKRIDQLQQCADIEALRAAVNQMYADLQAGTLDLQQLDDPPTLEYVLAELEQIAGAWTLARAQHYVARLRRGLAEVRTSAINDLNLYRWKEYTHIHTDSLWLIDKRDNSGAHSAEYWGNFVPQIPQQMLQRYTKQGDWVLDTFAGSGTTLIEGRRLGRNVLGIELQPAVAQASLDRVAAEPNPFAVETAIVTGDTTSLEYAAVLQQYHQQSVQLAIAHPPYFDIIHFSDDQRDLSNAASLDHFLAMFGRVAANVATVLEQGRYFVVVIGDKYNAGEWIPLGFQTMNEVLKHSFRLKSIVVKNIDQTAGKRQQHELWRYRALVGGFYVFKHEYLFVFQKIQA